MATTEFSNESERKTININEIPSGWEGLDAGPMALETLKKLCFKPRQFYGMDRWESLNFQTLPTEP